MSLLSSYIPIYILRSSIIAVLSIVLLVGVPLVLRAESIQIQSDDPEQVADTAQYVPSEDSENQQVALPDDQGSDTQTYTGKLSLTLATASDTGLYNNDRIIKNNADFSFSFSTSSSFPASVVDDAVFLYKSFPNDLASFSKKHPSRSCADSTVPTGSVNINNYLDAGTTWWYGIGTTTDISNAASTYTLQEAAAFTYHEGVHCFIMVYVGGGSVNSVYTSHSDPFEITIDTVRPTVTVVEPTAGKVYAYTSETTPETAKTKNNVTAANCTDSTSTASGWDDYAPNGTALSFSGNGRCFIFTDVAGNTKAAHSSAKVSGAVITDYDTNDNNLIDIDGTNAEALAKLDAMRYDLDGNGIPDSSTNIAAYRIAFPSTVPRGLISGCPSTCTGYELRRDLDFDTDGDGRTWTGSAGNPTGDTGDTYNNNGAGWVPIGVDSDGSRFTATFDGNGFVIDNLFINRSSTIVQALFAATQTGARITAVGLRNVNVTGANGSAALVGASQTGTVINTSFSTGTIAGAWATGGLVGYNGGTVEASYSSATVSGTTAVGGLVGNSQGSGASIKNSYAYGAVTQSGATNLGGLVGHSHASATITNSYWNNEVTAGAGTGTTGATGKTTTQLKSPTGYTGIYAMWDDSNIDGVTGADAPWDFSTDNQYPLLTFGGHQLERQVPFVTSLVPTPGDTQVTLTWMAGNTEDDTSWQFTYKTQAAADWESWAAVPSSTGSTRSHTVASLTNDTTYLFKVRPVGGLESEETAATPNTGIPATDFDSNDNNLIEITTLKQLNAMRYDLDGDGIPSGTTADKVEYYNAFKTSLVGFFCDACAGYELMNDLDFDDNSPDDRTDDTYNNNGSGWQPIGSSADSAFATTFDGNGFVIRNLRINRGSTSYAGLFGYVGSTAVLANIALKDVSVTAGISVGSLAGYSAGTIRTSYATGSVNGTRFVGGLVGGSNGVISTSYSTATVTGSDIIAAGGLVGGSSGATSAVKNSFATGEVTGTSPSIGGLIGNLIGNLDGTTVTTSYWDTQTTGQANSAGGTGKTTSELQSPISYTGIYSTWDDEDIDGDTVSDSPWDFGNDDQYPVLVFGGHQARTQRSFTLDLDASGTFVSRQDLLGTYLYLAEGISITQLRTYTHNQEQSVATEMAELIDESITGATPPLDFDGNGTASARLDILGAYLYTAEGISHSQLRTYTHNQEQSTANTMAGTIDALIE